MNLKTINHNDNDDQLKIIIQIFYPETKL